jgi:hypothetical protein
MSILDRDCQASACKHPIPETVTGLKAECSEKSIMKPLNRCSAIAAAASVAMIVIPLPGHADHQPLATATPVFFPGKFFEGGTEGIGSLKIMAGHRRQTLVRGIGRMDADGTLVLGQTVEQEGKPSKTREWRIRPLGGNLYAGSLTDASGPVQGIVSGNLLRLTFPMKGGLHADQRLYLAADGQSATNFMSVRKFGVVVARFVENIRRTGRPN